MGKLNIELFKKIRERIATIPESYDQEQWITRTPKAPCGYAACLAGEAIICNAPTVEQGIAELRSLKESDKNDVIPARAAALLGLSGSWKRFIESGGDDVEIAGESIIFDGHADHWPREYRSQFHDGDEAGAAVAYLDHIIETGKVLE